MRSAHPALAALALLAAAPGCTVVQTTFNDTYAVGEVGAVIADVENGDIEYLGGHEAAVVVAGTSWGAASQTERADDREDGNAYGVGVDGGALYLWAESAAGLAGVDFAVQGPERMHTDLYVPGGSVTLDGVQGSHTATARRISGDRVIGDVDLRATDGDLDLDVVPWAEGVVRVETDDGDIDLTLPYGLDYDLQVWGDPEHTMVIDALGMDQEALDTAYYAGIAGRGSIRVDVYAVGGDIRIHAAR